MSNDRYVSPLSERYASREMQYIFSPDKKFRTWRRLWIALAETEKELGLNITDEQIEELKSHADDINYDVAREREKIVRHDVMSHVYAYGVQCPKAKGIIHLGATSCYVGDNTDIIIMSEALKLVRKKLINVIAELAKFAEEQKSQPTLAFTHFQPAQPTTVGKRATLWMQEFEMDLEDLDHVLGSLKLLGSKGTTGTQASFLELFDGDQEKIDRIDPMIAEKMGFKACYPVSGQTYSRKVDTRVLNILAGIAALPLLPTSIFNRILSIFNLNDTSTSSRFDLWAAGLEVIQREPITGAGRGAEAVRRMVKLTQMYQGRASFVHCHNIYLQIWAEMGLLGIVSFLGTMLGMMKSAARAVRHCPNSPARHMAIGGTSAMLGAMVCGLADYLWTYPRIMFLFWFVFGLTLAAIKVCKMEMDRV